VARSGRGVAGGSQPIVVRPYRPSDRADLERALDCELREKVREATLRDLVHTPGIGAIFASHLLRDLRKAHGLVVVGEVGGKCGGFAYCHPENPSKWELRSLNFSRPFFLSAYVFPKFRRLNLDARLMAELESWAGSEGCDWIRVVYHEGYRWEPELYSRFGYRRSVVLMAKRLVHRTGKKDRETSRPRRPLRKKVVHPS